MRKQWVRSAIEIVLTLGAVLLGVAGCTRQPHFSTTAPPVPPEQITPAVSEDARIPVDVAIENFRVFDETKYPPDERELLRRTFSVQVPNLLFEALAVRRAFRTLERVDRRGGDTKTYVVAGTYDYFDQLGGGALGRIPYYGAYGTMIRAWVRETIEIVVIDARAGTPIWKRSYTDEHRKLGRSWERSEVEYQQPEYIGRVADGIIEAIARARKEQKR